MAATLPLMSPSCTVALCVRKQERVHGMPCPRPAAPLWSINAFGSASADALRCLLARTTYWKESVGGWGAKSLAPFRRLHSSQSSSMFAAWLDPPQHLGII